MRIGEIPTIIKLSQRRENKRKEEKNVGQRVIVGRYIQRERVEGGKRVRIVYLRGK